MNPAETREIRIPEDLVPPQNLDAEIAVLGSMLISEDAVAAAAEALEPAFFYRDAHKIIFKAMTDLFNENRAVDLLILADKLKNQGDLDDVGGVSYLTKLAETMPTAAHVEHYSRIVKEKAILRNLINAATRIVQEGYRAESDVDTFLDRAESIIFNVSSGRTRIESNPIKEIIKDSIANLESLHHRKTHVTGIATGFHDLDEKTSGLQPSDLIVVAGRPSMGKSALALTIAEHAGVRQKVPVVVFSLEMAKEQVGQRMLCSHARIPLHRARGGYLNIKKEWKQITDAASELSEAPIFIDDTPGISVLELRAKARRLKSRHDIGLIIVDYLQLMRGHSHIENRQQEISEISRSLKALARELSVPMIAVSQLSRAVESRDPARPRLADLRESGAIEQDADVVIMIYREKYYSKQKEGYVTQDKDVTDRDDVAEIIIAKQRNGPTGMLKLLFMEELVRFESLARGSVE